MCHVSLKNKVIQCILHAKQIHRIKQHSQNERGTLNAFPVELCILFQGILSKIRYFKYFFSIYSLFLHALKHHFLIAIKKIVGNYVLHHARHY